MAGIKRLKDSNPKKQITDSLAPVTGVLSPVSSLDSCSQQHCSCKLTQPLPQFLIARVQDEKGMVLIWKHLFVDSAR